MPAAPRDRARGIVGRDVAPLFPARGPIRAFLVGEAPGPRGADRSGIPFWGDRSGRLLYAALCRAGMAVVPRAAWSSWDGTRLAEAGLRPRLHGVALSNAVAHCPTKDRRSFCAPSARELFADDNRRRLLAELRRAARRCAGTLAVVALGRKAESLLRALRESAPPFVLVYVPHPSARALAAGRPGLSFAERQREWETLLLEALAGRPRAARSLATRGSARAARRRAARGAARRGTERRSSVARRGAGVAPVSGMTTRRRWSKRVMQTSDALDLDSGVFKQSDPRRIARSLKRSAERSRRRKADPFRSAMSMLNFYINRAGKKLSASRRRVLSRAKDELRRAFGRAPRATRRKRSAPRSSRAKTATR